MTSDAVLLFLFCMLALGVCLVVCTFMSVLTYMGGERLFPTLLAGISLMCVYMIVRVVLDFVSLLSVS